MEQTNGMDSKQSLRELALFAGAGGGILGGHLLGWRTVCAVEKDPYAAGVLLARQNDGCLAPFPVWDDVCTFDGRPWRGIVDVISGGFPCQDISVAGRGDGIDGERSGLWVEMARIVREVRPRYVFVENSPALTARGLGRVLGDLSALGFDAKWGIVAASDVGAPHRRERIWIVAHANSMRELQPQGRFGDIGRRPCYGSEELADPASIRQPKPWNESNSRHRSQARGWQAGNAIHVHGWAAEPDVGGKVDGMA